jgi:hypothetical protein
LLLADKTLPFVKLVVAIVSAERLVVIAGRDGELRAAPLIAAPDALAPR